MRLLYDLGIWFYVLVIKLVSPFNKKAKLWLSGKRNIFKQIETKIDKQKSTIWFHASSLGEFEQARPVIEKIREQYPAYQIVVTFFSPSGYEIRKNYKCADAVFYLPYDSKTNAHRFIELVNPDIAFFVKYDFWYHYLNQLHKRKIPTYLFSAIFRPKQLFFKSYGKWYRQMLTFFTFIFVQNKESEQLLHSVKITNCAIGGDTRFDRVWQIVQNAKEINTIQQFCNKQTTIVAGSSWEKDEELLLNYLQSAKNIKLIIAPHEVHNSNIKRLEKLCNNKALLFSKADTNNLAEYNILIIDSIGLLSSVYRYADIAYIGGGFGKGIHNTLEAAAYGIPVVFGTNYKKFQEAKDLIKREAGFSIKNQDELNELLNRLINNKAFLDKCSKNASEYVQEMIGGTDLLLAKLKL